ncbi:MAG: cohesin domain-containing protein, partial [Patescibacteria group bacterium]
MRKKLFIIVIFLTLAIPATIFLAVQRQELRQRAAPATTLSLSPGSLTKKVGETFSIEVVIDTAENQVVSADIYLTFDPTKLEAQTITNGALFPNILTSGVVASGTASITVGAPSSAKPVKGTGTAAVVRFKALEATTTPASIRFAANTFVGALGEGATNGL